MKIICTRQNLIEYNRELQSIAEKSLDIANDLWHNTIKMLITLSPTFLIASISFSDKIVPFESVGSLQKWILAISWVMFLISTFFGVISLLKEAEFFGLCAEEHYIMVRENVKKILDSNSEPIHIDFDPDASIKYNTLLYGVSSVTAFLSGVLNSALFLANKVHVIGWGFILPFNIVTILFYIFLVISHLKKRNNKYKTLKNTQKKSLN